MSLKWFNNTEMEEIYGEELSNAYFQAIGFVYTKDAVLSAADKNMLKTEIGELSYDMDDSDQLYEWKKRVYSEALGDDGFYYYCVLGEELKQYEALSEGEAIFKMKDLKESDRRDAMLFLSLNVNGVIYVITGETYHISSMKDLGN